MRPATEIATLYWLEGDSGTEPCAVKDKPSHIDRSTFAAACNSTDQLAVYAFNPNQP